MEEGFEYLGLREFLSEVRQTVEEVFPRRFYLKAELSSVQARANGHCYLELCEQSEGAIVARARAVVWRSRYPAISSYFKEVTGSLPSAGMQVLMRVQASYSELYGLTLTVDEIEPEFTLGAAERLRRETVARLDKEGLLDRQRSLDFAVLPYRLAVISASDAAGFGDFCIHLQENAWGFKYDVCLFPATMQGDGAPGSIISALDSIGEEEGYDAVLLLRGGGSSLDLACFDDYELCKAIALFPVPVFTAIGHERDVHVADMVAFRSVKTPTALADLFLEATAAEDERLEQYSTRLRLAFLNKINTIFSRLDVLEARIRGADPRNVLGRGYVLPLDSRGRVVRKAETLSAGDELQIMFADGTALCQVKELKH